MRLRQALGRETDTRPSREVRRRGKALRRSARMDLPSGRGYPALAFKGGCSAKARPSASSNSSAHFSWTPRYRDNNPARRAYTYDLEVVGSGTVTFPREPRRRHGQRPAGPQTVGGLRISAVRHTNWLPAKYRKQGWELFFINGKANGTATASADYSKPEGCSAHESGEFIVRAEVGNDGVGRCPRSVSASMTCRGGARTARRLRGAFGQQPPLYRPCRNVLGVHFGRLKLPFPEQPQAPATVAAPDGSDRERPQLGETSTST